MSNKTKNLKAPEAYSTYGEFFREFRELANTYGGMSADRVMAAYGRAANYTNPFVQNSRVKRISSFPVNYTKEQIAKMITEPYSSERQLRQISHALECKKAQPAP